MILSVDDEPTNHMVIEQMVRSQGYDFHEVRSVKGDMRTMLMGQGSCCLGRWYNLVGSNLQVPLPVL